MSRWNHLFPGTFSGTPIHKFLYIQGKEIATLRGLSRDFSWKFNEEEGGNPSEYTVFSSSILPFLLRLVSPHTFCSLHLLPAPLPYNKALMVSEEHSTSNPPSLNHPWLAQELCMWPPKLANHIGNDGNWLQVWTAQPVASFHGFNMQIFEGRILFYWSA